jgi:hypothetical protein
MAPELREILSRASLTPSAHVSSHVCDGESCNVMCNVINPFRPSTLILILNPKPKL